MFFFVNSKIVKFPLQDQKERTTSSKATDHHLNWLLRLTWIIIKQTMVLSRRSSTNQIRRHVKMRKKDQTISSSNWFLLHKGRLKPKTVIILKPCRLIWFVIYGNVCQFVEPIMTPFLDIYLVNEYTICSDMSTFDPYCPFRDDYWRNVIARQLQPAVSILK